MSRLSGHAGYCSVSDLAGKADLVTNQMERAKFYEQAQQVFYDDVPGIMLADVKAFGATRDNVRGFKLHFFGGQPFGGVSVNGR